MLDLLLAPAGRYPLPVFRRWGQEVRQAAVSSPRLHIIRLPVDDEHLFLGQQQVAVVVAEVVGVALLGPVDMGEVPEIEPRLLQHLPPEGGLFRIASPHYL
jgi:hypothetical protein